jgi:hypothetical protein
MDAMNTTNRPVNRELDREVELLVEQHTAQIGSGFAEYELRAIRNEGGFAETAVDALGFSYEHFGMMEAQAVSCIQCGGLFVDRLSVMRRHRIQCGWLAAWRERLAQGKF